MARSIEGSVEQALGVVASLPVGQLLGKEGIYIGRQPGLDGGQVVDLTAVGNGAVLLTESPTAECVFLQQNPNLWGLEDAVTLTISIANGTGREKIQVVSRPGEVPQLDPSRARLVNTVLGNIVTRLA